MFNDILILGFGLIGIIALLLSFVFKMLAWRLEDITITIPLREESKDIYNRIYNIRSFFEFCGIDEKCTVTLINYGVSNRFSNEILSFYEKYDFLKIVNADTKTGEI